MDAAKKTPALRKVDAKKLATLAMITAIAYVVMLLSKLMPSVYGFLDFDFKDVVICIGGFIYGPVSAAAVALVVALVEMVTVSHTGIWGFLMNFIATASFCCVACFVYKKHHTMKGAVIGLILGVISLVIVMLLWNYLITPLYMTNFSRADVAALLPTLFLPFNLAKGGMNMAATLLLYPPVVGALRRAGVVPPSQSGQGKTLNAGFLLFALALLATFVAFALVLAGVI